MAWKPSGYEVEVTTTVTIPGHVVQDIVRAHYNPYPKEGFPSYPKIAAIKDLRYWWKEYYPTHGTLGLREAKGIIEDGITHHARTQL